MEATVLLCDFAEAVNGKLYVMGGGWSLLFTPGQPANIALAIMVAVPWDQANQRHTLRVELLDHDGNGVTIGGQNVVVGGDFEIGRPPRIKPGTALNAPFTWAFNGLVLDEGGYEFKVSIDDDPVAARPFTVMRPPGLPPA